ncbi:class I SAM-dependent methyltransferase [Pseudomonas syringae]|uniref:class I SAM-dependent methyltransferase n=1 Tax=Pseudomonas syringae TaxID=317 RepID=UPI001F41449A|nr:class I SAM-dependent methyltransferase [Pseudomonas syringae]MCF5673561.1 class I SAM-dependent methyltransferase [Pseudomonas syringae]
MSLAQLYAAHEGFVSDKWDIYLSEYERLFNRLRLEPVSVLEIGVQNGGSVEIWNKYFPNATSIIGCDINPQCDQLTYSSDKIAIIIGDIKDVHTRSAIYAISTTLDIIIDDGSHTSSDIIEAFGCLFPCLKQGGIFVAEDLHCSYWGEWEGGLYNPSSSMAFFKVLADIINYEHWELDLSRTQALQPFGISSALCEELLAEIHSVEFVNSMCIITRRPIEQNVLGVRHVVGRDEPVCPVKQVDGTFCESPPQHVDVKLLEITELELRRKQLLEQLSHTEKQLNVLRINTGMDTQD